MKNQLFVWLHEERIGTLAQDKSGRMSFTYVEDAKAALSLSMPLREQPYDHDLCESFFGGLLPESEHARQTIGRRFGVNGRNSFSLLGVIGHECAGAISIFADKDKAPRTVSQSTANILNESELAKHIRELPSRPLLAGVEGIRISLAGAGDKAAVCVVDGKVTLPPDGVLSSHILKPNIGTIGDTVANEFFCMKLAEHLGLSTAGVELRIAEDIEYLLVKRYDRGYDETGSLVRLHQEDFCQALGVVSAHKYQNEGGPGYQQCFDLLRRVRRPAVDRNRMIEYAIFNFLVGNMDAHGKNFSVLHSPVLSLAPLYDVLSTRIYPNLSSRLAMRVDKYYDPAKIFPRHWNKLCESCGLSYPMFKRTLLEVCERMINGAEILRDEFRNQGQQNTYVAIVDHINRTAKTTIVRFNRDSIQE